MARRAIDLSETKVCEFCGITFTRGSLSASGRSERQWPRRRTCSLDCWGRLLSRLAAERRHPAYKGDAATSVHTGRGRAKSWFESKPCEVCSDPGERHHRDGDPLNNEPGNIVFLCHAHHAEAHYGPPRDEEHAKQRASQRARNRRSRERKRRGIVWKPPPRPTKICEQCGREYERPSKPRITNARWKERRFCTDACRLQQWGPPRDEQHARLRENDRRRYRERKRQAA